MILWGMNLVHTWLGDTFISYGIDEDFSVVCNQRMD